MSTFLSIFRLGKFTIQNFFRNFWLSFVTVTIFVLTLLTINIILVMNVVGDNLLQSIQEKVEVSVYFTPETSEDLVKSAQDYLLSLAQVRNVTFVSADDSLERFEERFKNEESVLASLNEIDGNPLGPLLVISAYSTDDFSFVLEALETPEYSPFIKKKDFKDYEQIISSINKVGQQVKIGGIILAGFFTLVAILIIFNTIRVAIYIHKEEIGIMKLVGANDWFVRGPFLLESVLYSLIAILVLLAVVFGILQFLDPWLMSFFGGLNLSLKDYFRENGLLIFSLQFIALSVLSLLTTLFAMRRYLKV